MSLDWKPENAYLEAAYWMPILFDPDFKDLSPEEKSQRQRAFHQKIKEELENDARECQ